MGSCAKKTWVMISRMSRAAIREWFERGTSTRRFAKEFLVSFAITAVAYSALYYLRSLVHWNLGVTRPFASERFWVTCLSFGFGFAIVGVGARKPRGKHEGMV